MISDSVSSMRTTAILLALVVIGCGPRGETPGVWLGGTGAAVPQSFVFVQEHEVIQLEARGSIFPRVVNIWGVGFDDAMYVWSDPGSGWSIRVAERPGEVRVRIGENVYELSATKVMDAVEKERVVAAYQAKYTADLEEMYGRPTTGEDFELFYRLEPRD